MTQPYPPYHPAGFPQPPHGMPVPPAAAAALQQEPGKRQYSFLAPWVKWYSPALWRDVGRRWRGINFWYLVLLLLVTWAVVGVKGFVGYRAWVRDESPKLVDQFPKVSMANGAITIDRPEPYTVADPDTGRPLIVFDTTGATTQPPPVTPSVLVTKDSMVVRQEGGRLQTTDLTPFQPFTVDANSFRRGLGMLEKLWFPVGVPVCVVFSLVFRLIQLLIYAGIASAVASSMRAPLTFGGTMRLAAVAVTPVILTDTVLDLAGLSLGCFWTIAGIAVALTLLIMAVRANAPTSPPHTGGFPVRPFPPPPPGGYGAGV